MLVPNLAENKRAERYRDIFIALAGLALFVYIFLRAQLLSFTVDENGTYDMFVSKGIIIPTEYNLFSANDHPLNTALMIFFGKIFGYGELSMRFPNVLAGLLYIWSTAMMARKMKPAVFSAAAFLVLNLNPYLVQYFSLARGYGLACGLTAFAFWQLWLYLEEGYAFRHLFLAMTTASLAIYAHFAYLNLYLPAAGFVALYALIRPGSGKISWFSRLAHPFFVTAAVGITLLVVLPIAMKMKAAGAIFTFGATQFWANTVQSVAEASLFDIPSAQTLKVTIGNGIEIAYWIMTAATLLWTVIAWRKGNRSIFPLFVLFSLTMAGVAVVLQYKFMGTEMVTLRMALFLLLPFLLGFVLVLDKIPGPKMIRTVLLVLVTIPLGYHFIRTLSLYHGFGWPTGEDNKTVVKVLDEYNSRQPKGSRLRIGVEPVLMVLGFEYYKQTHPLSDYDITNTPANLAHPMNDFCYLTAAAKAQAGDSIWQLYKEFPSGNVLMIRKNRPLVPKLVKQIGELVPAAEQKLDENKKDLLLIGQWKDSINQPAHYVAKVTTRIKQAGKTHVVFFITCHRGADEIFVQPVDLYLTGKNAGNWEDVTVTSILTDNLLPGDEVYAAMAWFSGPEVFVKKMTLTVEVY